MANNTLQQIATNLGVTGYDDTSLLIGIAQYYGVNTNHSNCLMYDILEVQGGDAANSVNYMEDLVIALSGTPNSLNVIEAWENATI
jgi:phosphoheptose isomerase